MSENYTNPDINGDTAYASIKAMMVDGKPTDIQRHYLIPTQFPPLTKEVIDSQLTVEWEILLTNPNTNIKLPSDGKVGYFVELKLNDSLREMLKKLKVS